MSSGCLVSTTRTLVELIVHPDVKDDEIIAQIDAESSPAQLDAPHSLCRRSLEFLRGPNPPTRSPAFRMTGAAGSSMCWKYNESWTALEAACLTGRVHVVQRLLQNGANPAQDNSATGITALHAALWGGNTEIVEVMLNEPAVVSSIAGEPLDCLNFCLRLPAAAWAVGRVLKVMPDSQRTALDCLEQFVDEIKSRLVTLIQPGKLPPLFRLLCSAAAGDGPPSPFLEASFLRAKLSMHSYLMQTAESVPAASFMFCTESIRELDESSLPHLSTSPSELARALATRPFTGNTEHIYLRLRDKQYNGHPEWPDTGTVWSHSLPPPQWQAALLHDRFPYIYEVTDEDEEDEYDDTETDSDDDSDGCSVPARVTKRTAAALGLPTAATHFRVPTRRRPEWNTEHDPMFPGGSWRIMHAPSITKQQMQQQHAVAVCVTLCFFDPLVRVWGGRLGLKPWLTPAATYSAITTWADSRDIVYTAALSTALPAAVSAAARTGPWQKRAALNGAWEPLACGTAECVLNQLTCAQVGISSGYLPSQLGRWAPAVGAVYLAILTAHRRRLGPAVAAAMGSCDTTGDGAEALEEIEALVDVGRVPAGWLSPCVGALRAWRGGVWGVRRRMLLCRCRLRRAM